MAVLVVLYLYTSGKTTKNQLKNGKLTTIGNDVRKAEAMTGSKAAKHTKKYPNPVLGTAHVLVASLKYMGMPKSLMGAIDFPRKIGAMGEIESSLAVGFMVLPGKIYLMYTGLPAYSDTGYSDTPVTVTVLAFPNPFINITVPTPNTVTVSGEVCTGLMRRLPGLGTNFD